jgi:hypothetical protein
MTTNAWPAFFAGRSAGPSFGVRAASKRTVSATSSHDAKIALERSFYQMKDPQPRSSADRTATWQGAAAILGKE